VAAAVELVGLALYCGGSVLIVALAFLAASGRRVARKQLPEITADQFLARRAEDRCSRRVGRRDVPLAIEAEESIVMLSQMTVSRRLVSRNRRPLAARNRQGHDQHAAAAIQRQAHQFHGLQPQDASFLEAEQNRPQDSAGQCYGNATGIPQAHAAQASAA